MDGLVTSVAVKPELKSPGFSGNKLQDSNLLQNLSSWKDRRRKQSEEALQRVAEVKALEGEGDDINQRQKL